jgi:hypothetical protein
MAGDASSQALDFEGRSFVHDRWRKPITVRPEAMSEAKREPQRISRGFRFWVWVTVASVAGALAFSIIFWGCVLGWWWDGFWLVLVGIFLGQSVGLVAESQFPAWRGSDAPFMIGSALGVGAMVILWLSLPEVAVAILGRVALAILGAATGSFFVVVAEFGRLKQRLKEDQRPKPSSPGDR